MPDALTVAYDSPVGRILIHSDGRSLIGLDILAEKDRAHTKHLPQDSRDPVISQTLSQLHEYFAGERTTFSVPVAFSGTPFQQKVWQALSTIPYGNTVTYQQLGHVAGVGNAPRAVGGAVGKNPIAIVIPCHRVLGSTGTITGYSAGEGPITKEHLLTLESASYRTTSHTSAG
jgi:methylated-DNA-[protein]-cysteine S-methyltransferase